MDTIEPEQRASSPDQSAHTRIRWIEDLADPQDRWLTITDAARITRTSEAMARRWVASGRLPMKRQPVGINQQTRLVRLSDLAAIRPIIDPMAAISDAIHTLDLPSIPRQHAHIMQEHERLLQQFQHGQQTLDELRQDMQIATVQHQQAVEDLRRQYSAQQEEVQHQFVLAQQQHDSLVVQLREQTHALEHTIIEQENRLERDLEQLRTTLLEHFTHTQQEVGRQLLALDQQHHQQREQVRNDFTTLLRQHQEGFHTRLTVLEEALAHLTQRHEQLEHTVATQHKELVLEHESLNALVEQQACEIEMVIERHTTEQIQDRNAFLERLEHLEQWLKHLTTQPYQQRLDAHDQRIQALTATLQTEIVARQTLNDHLEAQRQHMEGLHRAIERERKHAPETGA
ncbi:MAG: helix-turn-helix domain-containing protein [Ktedonobacteraceae bacterium]|nr:helix-turn-helix domain-containing protein [Chloroflexota bacterium]